MADITDASHVKYVEATLRQLCEELIRMRYKIQDAREQWTAGQNAIGNDPGDVIMDNFAGQETNEINAQNVSTLVGSLDSLDAILSTTPAINLVDQFRTRDISVIV